MPTPSVVKIDGQNVPNVASLEFVYETPTTESGQLRSAIPNFGLIELTRVATDEPMLHLFKLATNTDGTKKTFDGEINLVDTQNETTYAVTFKEAFVEEWSVGQTAANPRGIETVVLRVAELTFHAGSDNKSVNFKNYRG
jgi:hypothetical protein